MSNKIRRINFFGGACSGKSTLSKFVSSNLSMRGINNEYISEFIKPWTYIPRYPKGYNSHYLQALQLDSEFVYLDGGVDCIVSDSPLILQYFYAYYYKCPGQEAMLSIANEFEKEYRSLNIFLERDDSLYDEKGRYENLSKAKNIDIEIKKVLNKNGVKFLSFSCKGIEDILTYIINKVS